MRKKLYIIIVISVLLVCIVGVTLALVYFRSEVTNVNLTASSDIGGYINYNSGDPVLSTDGKVLNSSEVYTDGIFTEIEFWKTEIAKNMDIYGHIYLDITTGSDELLNMEGLKWAVTSDDVLISEGNFVNYSQGDSLPILVNQKLLTTLTKFKVYVWIDQNAITSTAGQGEIFSVYVRCEATTGEYDFQSTDEYKFDFIDDTIQTVNLTPGSYRLEVWGAQGGASLNNGVVTGEAGYGGYASGVVKFSSKQTLYICVGGQGSAGVQLDTADGGYNGGGSGTSDGADNEAAGGGGGATHIATKSGLLSSLSDNREDILIVAGGGGGKSWTYPVGSGGGAFGGYTTGTSSSYPTQISGFAFGQGQDATGTGDSDGVAGGGGGFFGGYSNNIKGKSSGTGGSGYIGNVLLTDKVMYCYGCEESSDISSKTIKTENVSLEAVSEYAKRGNGYAKITVFGSQSVNLLSRQTITYGTSYDFKTMIRSELDENLTVTYSTYNNANELKIGEYQIKYIAEDSDGNVNVYYQKVEIK